MGRIRVRFIMVALVVGVFAIGMAAFLNYFKYKSTFAGVVRERVLVVGRGIENSVQTSLSLGMQFSELLPHTAKCVDDIALVKTVHTNAINHDPACTFVMSGNEIPGRPSIGSWISYGLGSENNDLPAFVVFTPKFPDGSNGQAIYSRMWGSGFLPTKYGGVALRGGGDPVLYLKNPDGVSADDRRVMLDSLNKLNAREDHHHPQDHCHEDAPK